MNHPHRMGTEETGPMDPIQPRMKECDRCKGQAVIYTWDTLFEYICPTCRGTGLVPAEEPEPMADTRGARWQKVSRN